MTGTTYRPDIDGLRAVAVLAVVLHHLSAPLMPGGYVGVDVFFVISGYLITQIISREMADGSFTFARFYERRARRIFPALFAVMAATLVAGYFVLLPSDYAGTLRGALGTLFFASNVVFWRDMAAGYFAATDAALNPLLHTWSLAVEEQFYVFFPPLLLLCLRQFRRHIIPILFGCAVVSLAGAVWWVQSKSVAVFFLSPFRAWELLVGALLALNAIPGLRSRVLREGVAGAGLLAVLAACFFFDSKTPFPGLAALLPVLGTAAIIHAGTIGPTAVANVLCGRPMVYVGLISYSLYLWHWPVIVLTRYVKAEPSSISLALLFVVSLVLAALSYHFVEKPFRHRQQVTRRFVLSSSAAFASVLVLFSLAGFVRNGFESRFDPSVVKLDKARETRVPFLACDGKPVASACLLGSSEGEPMILLWGDSHLLAWAPALDEILNRQGLRAVFAPHSACPPIFDVDNLVRPACLPMNDGIKAYLLANPSIKTVILSAHWGAYFSEVYPLRFISGDVPAMGTDAAIEGLLSTVQWVRQNGRQAVLIGPVPVYEKSIPLALAMSLAGYTPWQPSTGGAQRTQRASFFNTVAAVQPGEDFRFLDPIGWMCTEDCLVMKSGVPLYRDATHLSVPGALAFASQIAYSLDSAGAHEGIAHAGAAR